MSYAFVEISLVGRITPKAVCVYIDHHEKVVIEAVGATKLWLPKKAIEGVIVDEGGEEVTHPGWQKIARAKCVLVKGWFADKLGIW